MIEVTYLDHMGDDLAVVNAARVSFDNTSELVTPETSKSDEKDEVHPLFDQWATYSADPEFFLDFKDYKLIYYLAKHQHKSPFNHAFAKFRVKAPIFVARQLVKHEYLVWNEVSRRYVDDPPEFYYPEALRKKANNKKQGSSDETVKSLDIWDPVIGFHGNIWDDPISFLDMVYTQVESIYKTLLLNDVAPEQARMVLPQSLMTEWIWSGSLYAFAKMCALRLDEHAQYETRITVKPIDEKMSELFPVSWSALKGNIL